MRVVALALVLAAGMVVVGSASGTQHESAAQACVDRWNWAPSYGPNGPDELVRVMTHPCQIFVHYQYGDRFTFDDCWVNQHRVYQCAEHAGRPVPSYLAKVKRAPVGTMHGNVITLRGATRATVRPRPKWMTRYRWDYGFIVPFDQNGRVLPSIHATRDNSYKNFQHGCGRPYDAQHLMTSCALGLYVIYPRWPLRKGDLMAFAFDRGTRTYGMQRYVGPCHMTAYPDLPPAMQVCK